MSKPVPEIYINRVVCYTGKGVIAKQETKRNEAKRDTTETKQDKAETKEQQKNHQ
jgi:hypothetical protein